MAVDGLIKLEAQERAILLNFLAKVREKIIALQKDKGLRASGASAAAMREEVVEENKTGLLLDPLGYMEFEEYGRGPTGSGGKGTDLTLQQRIYQWLEFRKYGFNWINEKQRLRFSWAIAMKIHKRGTLTHITGRPTGVLTEAINQDQIEQLGKELGRMYAVEIESDIVKEFKA